MSARQLQEFCKFVQGGRHKLSGKHFVYNGYPAFGAGGLNGFLPQAEFNTPGIVLSAVGARCGKCFLAEGAWTSLANTQVIFPEASKVDIRFLWYQLNDEQRWPRHGLAQPFIRPSDVKAHLVYLPSLDEQKRIAAILDKADTLRVQRRRAIALLESLTQSIFLEMFGDPEQNPFAFPVVELGSLIESGPTNGLYKPASSYGDGTRILRINNFYDGSIVDLDSLRRLRVSEKEKQAYALREGDVVINRVNSREYLGKSALVPSLEEPVLFESNMMRLSLKRDLIAPKFCTDFLQSGFVKRQIAQKAKDAVNQSSINQGDVRSLKILLPPITKQTEYVNLVLAAAKTRERLYAAQTQDDRLFASAHHRAFHGEL